MDNEQILKGLREIYKQNKEILDLLKSLSGGKLAMLEGIWKAKQEQQTRTIDLAKEFGGEIVG